MLVHGNCWMTLNRLITPGDQIPLTLLTFMCLVINGSHQNSALHYSIESTGATEIKYMDHPRAQRRGDHTRFVQHYPVRL
jgi:hypothetical protein